MRESSGSRNIVPAGQPEPRPEDINHAMCKTTTVYAAMGNQSIRGPVPATGMGHTSAKSARPSLASSHRQSSPRVPPRDARQSTQTTLAHPHSLEPELKPEHRPAHPPHDPRHQRSPRARSARTRLSTDRGHPPLTHSPDHDQLLIHELIARRSAAQPSPLCMPPCLIRLPRSTKRSQRSPGYASPPHSPASMILLPPNDPKVHLHAASTAQSVLPSAQPCSLASTGLPTCSPPTTADTNSGCLDLVKLFICLHRRRGADGRHHFHGCARGALDGLG